MRRDIGPALGHTRSLLHRVARRGGEPRGSRAAGPTKLQDHHRVATEE